MGSGLGCRELRERFQSQAAAVSRKINFSDRASAAALSKKTNVRNHPFGRLHSNAFLQMSRQSFTGYPSSVVGSSDGGTLVVFEKGNHVCFNIPHKFLASHARWTAEYL
jgi:hypothetical protein